MSPKQQRGEETADRLLDAALQVYADHGEQGVTVSALTKASGISLGSLYHHFGSVDGLMTALVLRWLSRLLGELTTALGRSRTARTGVRALVRTYLTFVQENPAGSRLVHSSYSDRLVMAEARQLRDAQEARLSPLTEWMQQHIESGEIARLPLPVIEALVLGPVVATARRSLSGIDDVDLDEAKRVLPARILASISA